VSGIDFEAEAADDGPNEEGLKLIGELAARQRKVEDGIAELEDRLKKGKALLRRISEVDLPAAMAEARCLAFKLDDGYELKIDEGISASLADGKKADAIAWLIENGYGDIVTNDITVSFGQGEEEKVTEVVELLREAGHVCGVKQDVNTARVKAIIKERMEAGLDVPMDTLGAFHWKKSVIKAPKKSK